MPIQIIFRKTGKEIKTAVQKRREQLEGRLTARNRTLDEFMQDNRKVRSYLIRQSEGRRIHTGDDGYTLYSSDDISSEEKQEITQLCRRIFEIEQELHRLALIGRHLQDDQVFDLSFEDLIGYGFDASLESE
jgi:hypothetical protein